VKLFIRRKVNVNGTLNDILKGFPVLGTLVISKNELTDDSMNSVYDSRTNVSTNVSPDGNSLIEIAIA
jgi:hypothetical protein